jgi:hypothetical protein
MCRQAVGSFITGFVTGHGLGGGVDEVWTLTRYAAPATRAGPYVPIAPGEPPGRPREGIDMANPPVRVDTGG